MGTITKNYSGSEYPLKFLYYFKTVVVNTIHFRRQSLNAQLSRLSFEDEELKGIVLSPSAGPSRKPTSTKASAPR